jgi:hypothetical protein
MTSWLLERDNIWVEEACDAITLALEEAERDEIVFTTEVHPQIWEEVAERARKVGYEAKLAGRTLTVRRRCAKG